MCKNLIYSVRATGRYIIGVLAFVILFFFLKGDTVMANQLLVQSNIQKKINSIPNSQYLSQAVKNVGSAPYSSAASAANSIRQETNRLSSINSGLAKTGTTTSNNNTGGQTTYTESWGGGGGGGIDYNSILAQLQEQVEAAYNRAKSALESTLSSTLSGLESSYNTQKADLTAQYDNSKKTLDDNTENDLRQAYINKMINARDMSQLMTAQGLTGGASETNLAKMLNTYANNRNGINKTAATNLRELLTSHNSNLADALVNYNDKVASARQNYANYLAQLEQNRANALIQAMPSFSSLTSLLG